MAAIMIRKVLDCSDGKAWRKLGPFLSNDFFFADSPLFARKTGKAGKTENGSKVWKFNRGQNIWNASHSNIWKEKIGQYGNTKFARKLIMWKFGRKVVR